MIPAQAPAELGQFRVLHDGPFVAGMHAEMSFAYEVGEAVLAAGGKIRVGLPNTGWQEPVPPQQRYWDELVQGIARRLAPFHPTNTTANATGPNGVNIVLEVMERMLAPDEDPAIAYWRWWITATVEGGDLKRGDVIRITYRGRVQTFVEQRINVVAFIRPGDGPFYMLGGSPWFFDVVAGPAARANVVVPSTHDGVEIAPRISVTDVCHCRPRGANIELVAKCRANPSVRVASDGLRLFWGDLHAQSEHHVMHSQKKDFRQGGWSKGISCGTVDECYEYARQISMLDFVALTDQGACLTDAWEFCQSKVREHNAPGRFVTFKGYEAGAPNGHRNVIYVSDEIEAPLDAKRFSSFAPQVLYDYYRERGDAILIPHHVKTWTDWSFHDPELEPLMEIYSCWGQSESPEMTLWDKGTTPGAGAWAAFERGYRMGMIASSDNHVGMPGRSYPGDRQAHTPFKGGLCAIWAEELTRESLFAAMKQRRCYGTTGARIIVRFSVNDLPMGSAVAMSGGAIRVAIEVVGTDELRAVEIVAAGRAIRALPIPRGENRMATMVELPVKPGDHFYLRISQIDGERAWTSPIFID